MEKRRTSVRTAMTAAVRGGVGNFPEKILPDGESGSFFVHRILPAAAGDRPEGGSR